MASSGTYTWAPVTGELVLAAYARNQIRRSEIVTEHLVNAANEANLLQVAWANLGPTLWTIDLQSVSLVQGTASYSVPSNTVMVLDAYISIPNGDGTYTDRIITPLSRSEYAAMPDKSQQGAPTSFWYDRLDNPTITLWTVPDDNGPYTLNYYRFTQSQDVALSGGLNLQAPYLWLDAFVAGLAHRLAILYKPEAVGARKAEADEAYRIAAAQNTENVNMYVAPQANAYWR